MNIGYGTYLTPQERPTNRLPPSQALSRSNIRGGLIYTQDKQPIEQSIDNRFAVIPMNTDMTVEDMSNETFLFLGFYFRHYGHFILETLPMLSFCLDPSWLNTKKLFLPYFLNTNVIKHNLDQKRRTDLLHIMYQFMQLMGMDINDIQFHTNYSILKSNFIVPPKIINGNKNCLNVNPYVKVIDKIKSSFNPIKPDRKILINRKPKPNRVTPYISDRINDFAVQQDIEIIDMERLSIKEQILLMHETKYLIGFSGSGMHNSMFLQPGSISINICDIRDSKAPKSCIPNQKLCNRISKCQEYFIDFEYEKSTDKHHDNKLTDIQESFAVDHMIESLYKIIL
jgi:hypothetical protein